MSTVPSAAGTGRSWTDGGSPKLRTANARILTSQHRHPSRKYRCKPGCHGGRAQITQRQGIAGSRAKPPAHPVTIPSRMIAR
jgi:hypothetical protein